MQQHLEGTGLVARQILVSQEMFQKKSPSHPVDDASAFAIPANAAEPAQVFEGTLTLDDVSTNGNFTLLGDIFKLVPNTDSPWKHLAPFQFEFVQSGNYLIPIQQGLAIVENSSTWNYIVGPGRVWHEQSDGKYMRVAFPFALVQRNQNCVHNGEMTFLFSDTSTPNISNVYYQITQETCYPMKFNLWGMIGATYTPHKVENAADIQRKHQEELVNRLPTKPFSDLKKDFPNSGVDLPAFSAAYKHPENVTTYGLIFKGTNYVADCPTRSGQYAFCADMRVPSYSIAKSVFAGVALMRLGERYSPAVYDLKIKDFIPQSSIRGKWSDTTFGNASDMATGNFNSPEYESDEDSSTNDAFLIAESYETKLTDAFAFHAHSVTAGTKWVYQSAATYILTQAMNHFWQQRGGSGDIFTMVRDDVFEPLHFSQGGLTTIRTNHSPTGAPTGYYGLFFNQDDIAKVGNFLNTSEGMIGDKRVLARDRLAEALFRSANAGQVGVAIEGLKSAPLLGAMPRKGDSEKAQSTRRYSHGFWGRKITHSEFSAFPCDYWISFMSGYGGNIVMLLPDGATFYIFSDEMEFPWQPAVNEINKLAPLCK